MTIELLKNPTLGISITGGINGENLCHPGDPCLYVYNMAEGKPAKMSGQIQIGDRILSVSDCMIELKYHSTINHFLTKTDHFQRTGIFTSSMKWPNNFAYSQSFVKVFTHLSKYIAVFLYFEF